MKTLLAIITLLTTANIIAAEKKIIRNTDRFELTYSITLPEIKGRAKLWIPLARTDSHQRFETLSIESPSPWHKTRPPRRTRESPVQLQGAARKCRHYSRKGGHLARASCGSCRMRCWSSAGSSSRRASSRRCCPLKLGPSPADFS